MSHGSQRNGSPVADAVGGEEVAEANGDGISKGGLRDDGGGGGVGFISAGSTLSRFDSGPGDTVMLSAFSSSLWKKSELLGENRSQPQV